MKFILIFLFSMISVLSVHPENAWAQSSSTGKGDAPQLFGEVTLTTNYVDKGITQTEKDPAIQTGLGYGFGKTAKLGFWASNVRYPDESAHLNLKFFGAYKFIFNSNWDLSFRYDLSKYYKSASRNGSIVSLDFNIYTYHVMVEKNDNWEGTLSESTWYGLGKDFNISGNWVLETKLGNSMVTASGYSSYFDVRTGIDYKLSDFVAAVVATYASNSSQFNGRADFFYFFEIKAKF